MHKPMAVQEGAFHVHLSLHSRGLQDARWQEITLLLFTAEIKADLQKLWLIIAHRSWLFSHFAQGDWLILHLLPKVDLQTFTSSVIPVPSCFPLAIELQVGSYFFGRLTDRHDLQLLLENGCVKSFHQSLKIFLKSLFFFHSTWNFFLWFSYFLQLL